MIRPTLILILFAFVLFSGCVNDSSNGQDSINTTNNTTTNITNDTASLPNETDILTPRQVLDNSNNLIGKTIYVRGIANPGESEVCTERVCLHSLPGQPKNPCCNSCTGPLMLEWENSAITLASYKNADIGCWGNECGLHDCHLLESGKTYLISGVWDGVGLDVNFFKLEEYLIEDGVWMGVSTDKNEYFQGENVTISIKNNFEDVRLDIYLPFYTIERFESGNWTEIVGVICPCEVLCRPAASVFVEPNETREYIWDQTGTWCSDSEIISETLSEQVPAGTYRVRVETISPWLSVRPAPRIAVYSDVFEIREAVASNDLVISTDKNEYREGEKVVITVINNINESVEIVGGSGCEGNFFIVSQNTAGGWNDYSNTCGACEMYLSTFIEANGSRTFEWSQEIYGEVSECVPPENAPPGSYKIKIMYRIDDNFSIVYSDELEIKEVS